MGKHLSSALLTIIAVITKKTETKTKHKLTSDPLCWPHLHLPLALCLSPGRFFLSPSPWHSASPDVCICTVCLFQVRKNRTNTCASFLYQGCHEPRAKVRDHSLFTNFHFLFYIHSVSSFHIFIFPSLIHG